MAIELEIPMLYYFSCYHHPKTNVQASQNG